MEVRLTCGILAHGFARARRANSSHDFLVAFACKGRGVCPSCTTRRMAETAAHLVDLVLAQVPVRQWVLALPKRLRQHHTPLVNPVLRIFLAEVEAALRSCSHDAPDGARFGAVTLMRAIRGAPPSGALRTSHFAPGKMVVHRFVSALNANLHFHCCVIDGVFSEADEGVRFHPACLTDRALAKGSGRPADVLKLFQRRELLPAEAVETMQAWEHLGSDRPTHARTTFLSRLLSLRGFTFTVSLSNRRNAEAGRRPSTSAGRTDRTHTFRRNARPGYWYISVRTIGCCDFLLSEGSGAANFRVLPLYLSRYSGFWSGDRWSVFAVVP
ncbi:MAG: transposase zinc-binding domain-containing protein [Methylotetracoccus sp.]|jgi:hypothetical protein|nr:transposase zinc-binding domain-containing protein [Methylotetracoccus sp.]